MFKKNMWIAFLLPMILVLKSVTCQRHYTQKNVSFIIVKAGKTIIEFFPKEYADQIEWYVSCTSICNVNVPVAEGWESGPIKEIRGEYDKETVRATAEVTASEGGTIVTMILRSYRNWDDTWIILSVSILVPTFAAILITSIIIILFVSFYWESSKSEYERLI